MLENPDSLLQVLKEAGDVFRFCSRKTKVLAALAWKAEVATDFFKKKAGVLPEPSYEIDRKAMSECLAALRGLAPKVRGEHPVLQWLSRMQESFVLGALLLLETEKDTFFDISSQLYGNAMSPVLNGKTTNLELANAISQRLSVCALNDIGESFVEKSAEEFAALLNERIQKRIPLLPVRVEITDQIVSKVAAGGNRLRIRKDARFSSLELDALWNHEIESHCLTAQNGAAQEHCSFLASGGPRTTLTQEGLAVFYEVYGHTMSQRRFISLCERIQAVSLAENGATFVDLYRWYLERSPHPMDAFYNAQRIFRGAKLSGRKPFTKDTVYLSGLINVYNFLRIGVKNQNRILVESLLSGRMALEDVGTIAWLRARGFVSPPRFIPDWLKNWEALLSFFSLTAVIETVDLGLSENYFTGFYTLDNWDLKL